MTANELLDSYPDWYQWQEGTYLPPHSCGLPAGWVKATGTDRQEIDGYHVVLVYWDRVVLAGLRYPTNHNDWRTLRTHKFDSVAQLQASLRDLTKAPVASCMEAMSCG